MIIDIKNAEASFLLSTLAVDDGCKHSLIEIMAWVNDRRTTAKVDIELINFSELKNWLFDPVTQNLRHETGRFFSIDGIDITTNWGTVKNWSQPIINQPEIGILGMVCKKINGVLHFLIQAKIEPGNINHVQLSPTLQATKSNYTAVHKGKAPTYLEYFNGSKNTRKLLDQLQSEQGARFLRKRNRNIIVETDDNIAEHPDFRWVTLGQIKQLMRQDNLVNVDTRTVISGISYGNHNDEKEASSSLGTQMLYSATHTDQPVYAFEEIIGFITHLKAKYELDVKPIPLNTVKKWIRDESTIHHENNKYFSVVAANIFIHNREVSAWSQPLVKPAQEGLVAFVVKKINGIYHFLVQAKLEAGNFDVLELAPTVQCLTGNYRDEKRAYDVPFIDTVLNADPKNIIYKAMQSEEGGRFFKESNLNMIVEVDDQFTAETSENYFWMTLNQLLFFIKFNNYLNIQARGLIAAINFSRKPSGSVE